MTDRPEILSASQLAAWLDVTPQQVTKLARAKKLPGFRVGVDWRFRRSVIEAWIEEQEKHGRRSA